MSIDRERATKVIDLLVARSALDPIESATPDAAVSASNEPVNDWWRSIVS